jgi:hypothetical protein
VHTTAFVSLVTARSKAASVSSGSKSRSPATVTAAPRWCSGRVTELCSNPEITTASPGLTSVLIARLSPCVAFIVNTTCSGAASKSAAAARRQS